ncbi:helix-turn-helix transcriptional regulator [Phycisphaerales bacterium AB-hyl4]|uniref:Helix-turn-helix transcriptional regulator n=1 Tax=Natronomicrosphaera hydrolytica TaxID=3242702 RepID=A0ABV4U385_9BACT
MNVSRVHRLLRLITLMQSGRPRKAPELMEELNVSRRTLFRDLKMLQAAGIPYYHTPGEGYRLRSEFFLPPVNLTVAETVGLMMLGKAASADRQRPMVMPALSAIYKLLSTVPEPIRSACGEMMAHVSVDPGAVGMGERESAFYPMLQQCVDERRACQVVYGSPVEAEPIRGELEPYVLHFVNRAWYVLGRSSVHQEVRVFKLARFESIDPLPRCFRRPKRFQARDKLGKAWQLIPEGEEHEVELEFSAMVGRNVSEVRWHPTQEHELLPDGRCVMRFTVDGLGEIAWWLCGYADQVKVRKPDALRERVGKMLHAALMNYR